MGIPSFFSYLIKNHPEIIKQIKSNSLKFDNFYLDSPGNLLNYLIHFKDSDIDIYNDKLSCIFYLIEKYKSKKDFELLPIISLFIEQYYNELSLNNKENLNQYFINKHKIINGINNMKKFNLDKKNLLISIEGILKNEAR